MKIANIKLAHALLFGAMFVSMPVFSEASSTNSVEKATPVAAQSVGVGAAELSQTIVGLAAIVGLLFLASFLMKRFKLVQPSAAGEVSVVSQIPLSVKEKLLVLQIGDEKILVGNAAGNMRTLHRWASPAEQQDSLPKTPVFARLLKNTTLGATANTVTALKTPTVEQP
ncbi:FliO/MopB family protein [Spongiibacter sp. KMU-158]|uniref:FliO/MopB family protein n=1 Tax=Spongiibacter pelagi TaxID=2760804 RepID=A0A927C274_9GAMM|nr:flagellar biosynthetic protein FliO [Spongiibacter pelagi]MBD2858441.1 FliO/MopB family protein [Spongiibacter pelagi]